MVAIFDKSGAIERVDNDIELLKELVELCAGEHTSKIGILRSAVERGESKAVSEIAHSMKSAFGNVGAMVAYQAALQLEYAGRQEDTTSFTSLLEVFERATKEFFDFFEREKGALG